MKLKEKIQLILLTPFWLSSTSPTRKSWKEFKSGLIKHTCDFDYDYPKIEYKYPYYKCKHFGCNIVTYKDL